jgi:hypothetical protein
MCLVIWRMAAHWTMAAWWAGRRGGTVTITESDRISGHRTIGQPPNADSAPLSAVERAAVTKRRSASSELLPRDQMRVWMSAAKCGHRPAGCTRPGCSAARGE